MLLPQVTGIEQRIKFLDLDTLMGFGSKNVTRYLLFAILVFLLFVGFFAGEFLKGPWGLILRLVAFLAVVVIVFSLIGEWELESEEPPEAEEVYEGLDHIQPAAVKESEPFWERESLFNFYREISDYTKRLMELVKATFMAHSAILFLWDQEISALRVHRVLTDSRWLEEGDIVEVEGTLPGMVFRTKGAVLEGDIPQHPPLSRYYQKTEPIRSFLGVPICPADEVTGVLAIDSKVEGAFGDQDLDMLSAYKKLLEQGLILLSERERFHMSYRSLLSQGQFLAKIATCKEAEEVFDQLAKAAGSLFEYNRLTVSTLDEDDQEMARIVRVLGEINEMGEGFRFKLLDGLNGWLIRQARPLLLSDLEDGDLFHPRFSRKERTNYGLHSFLGVPIQFADRVFGAISIESRRPDFYSLWDQRILSLLATNAAMALCMLETPFHRISPGNSTSRGEEMSPDNEAKSPA